MTPSEHLELVFASRGAHVVAGINDAPILRNRDGVGVRTRMPLALWLMPKDNQLTLTIDPLAELPAEGPLVDVAIAAGDHVTPPQCRVAWSLPAGSRFDPINITLPFVPRVIPETRLFQEAKRFVELPAEKRRQAQSFGMDVYRAFQARNVERVVEYADYRLEETARAFGDDEEVLRHNARSEYASWFKAPSYTLIPLREESIRVTPCCGGRVFLLTRADDGDLIQVMPGGPGPAASVEIFVAFVDGEWQVVR